MRNTWDIKDIRDINNIRGTRDTKDTRDIRDNKISGIPKTRHGNNGVAWQPSCNKLFKLTQII